MVNAIRRGFHTDVAGFFANEIRYQRSNYYYFLGKVEPWNAGDVAPATSTLDSALEDDLIRSNALFLKKISPNDISLVTTRHDWATGVRFAKWDHTKDMSAANFYCVTNEYNVYKCLDNAGGSVSTVKPTGTSFFVFRTADGFLWKYMYSIPAFKRSRFISQNYIPVQKSLTDSFYNKGSVDEVVVTARGSGYTDAQRTTIVVTGTTTGSGATGNLITGTAGKIVGVTITSGGSGYTAGVNLVFAPGTGAGAVVNATIVNGIVTGVTIVDAGIGYVNDSPVTFQVGGAVLVPVVSRETGSIHSVKIIKPGTGYVAAPTLVVFDVDGYGTGKYGRPKALVAAVLHNGKIVEVTVSDPGINYPSSLDTTITVTGNGTGAVFSPVIHDSSVVDVVIENPGVGYTSISLSISGSGTGATIKPIVSASDFISDQSIVEQTATRGAIYAVEVSNPGTDYYAATTTVSIVGDGTGCIATPVVVGGKIIRVIVSGYGTNYSYARVVFTDTQRNTTTNSINAVAYVILPPSGGHGVDAVSELFGSTVAINSSLRQEPFLNNIMQDYRQFGLIRNPTNIVTGKSLDADSYLITYTIVLDTIEGLSQDDVLTFDNVKFRVITIGNNNTVVVQQLGSIMSNPIGTMMADSVVGDVPRTYQSSSVLSYPVANKYTGSLLYVSNEPPFSFTENQGITIKTYLTF